MLHESPLLLRQPFRILREIRQKEEEDGSHDSRKRAFQNEDPPPSAIPFHPIHFSNRAGEKTAKRAGKSCAGEEEAVSLLALRSLVPHADDVECSGEHVRFRHTEEEARREQTGVVLDETLTDCDDTEEEHTQGDCGIGQ